MIRSGEIFAAQMVDVDLDRVATDLVSPAVQRVFELPAREDAILVAGPARSSSQNSLLVTATGSPRQNTNGTRESAVAGRPASPPGLPLTAAARNRAESSVEFGNVERLTR